MPATIVLLQEAAEGRRIAPAKVAGAAVTSCGQSFELASDEGIYGLGQHQHGAWNYARWHSSVRLAQANTDVGVPVITSSKGYMMLWDNPGRDDHFNQQPGYFEFRPKSCTLVVGVRQGHRLLFLLRRRNHRRSNEGYRHLTGKAPLMPKWKLGFWQCKERYASQEELLGVAKRMRELKVPVDGIIQDWQYWPPGTNTWGSHLFDPKRYPDPVAMFKELHDDALPQPDLRLGEV